MFCYHMQVFSNKKGLGEMIYTEYVIIKKASKALLICGIHVIYEIIKLTTRGQHLHLPFIMGLKPQEMWKGGGGKKEIGVCIRRHAHPIPTVSDIHVDSTQQCRCLAFHWSFHSYILIASRFESSLSLICIILL